MKRKIGIAAILILAIYLLYFFGTGFLKIGSAYISDYAVSEDGREITLDIGVAASAGFIRSVEIYQQEGGKLYIDCYSAFGGFNGSIGAKSSFTLPLDEDTESIGIYRNTDCYEEVLRKDAEGVWQWVK